MTTTVPTTFLFSTHVTAERMSSTYALIRTVRIWPGVDDGHTLQVTVRVDPSHPRQGSYRAEVWTPAGWTEVARILPEDPAFPPPMGPYYGDDVPGQARDMEEAFLELVCGELIRRAGIVLA